MKFSFLSRYRFLAILTFTVLLSHMVLVKQVMSAELVIDGIKIGQTSCRDAIHTVLVNKEQNYTNARLTPQEVASQTRLLRTLLKKPRTDRTMLSDLYREQAAQTEKQELQKLSLWSPETDTKGFTCALPGFNELGASFATAFDLIQPGSMSLENLKIRQCPYKRFYSAAGISTDSSQPPLACLDNKASFYSKNVHSDYSVLKREFAKKFGEAKELSSKLNLSSLYSPLQTIQLSSLYKAGDNFILLVNIADNMSGKTVLDSSEISFRQLRPSQNSEVYYFTRQLYDVNQKNKLMYLSLERKQIDVVQKKNLAFEEKHPNKR